VDEAKGRVPVLAGAGGYDTREVIHLAGLMKKAGAQGLLSVTPYYNKPTQEGLYLHYRAIAESTDLPINVYNVPGRAGVNVEPMHARPSCGTAQRHRGQGGVGQHQPDDRHLQAAALRLHHPLGDDALTLPLMAIGGRGVISVASNEIPADMVEMVSAAARGDFATARSVHIRILSLMQVNFVEAQPGAHQVGDGDDGPARGELPPPMCPPTSARKEKILRVLEWSCNSSIRPTRIRPTPSSPCNRRRPT
jgi:4-hydroxy-tetrahydrodipicolinate synthase